MKNLITKQLHKTVSPTHREDIPTPKHPHPASPGAERSCLIRGQKIGPKVLHHTGARKDYSCSADEENKLPKDTTVTSSSVYKESEV